MALSAEVLAAITAVRKENEDLVKAIITEVYLTKQVEIEAVTGDNVIVLPGDPYDNAQYVINIYSAKSSDGMDVTGELGIKSGRTVSGFTVTAVTPCKIKIITHRETPKITYWT